MPTSPKKAASKPRSRAPPKAANGAGHPSWVEMITDCIVSHPEDARNGVSRPTIKKFVETKYGIELTATAASQLNRAITGGSEKGIFVLPKGASGKVKLAPKRPRTDAAKENTKPPSKKTSTVKPAAAKAPAPKGKTAAGAAKVTIKKPSIGRPKPQVVLKSKAKAAPVAVKKAAATKKTTSTAKAAPAKKPKKATSVKKGAVKKSAIGETKKPVLKSKGKPVSKGKGAKVSV